MEKYKRMNSEDTNGFQRNSEVDGSTLEQQIQEYETTIEKVQERSVLQEKTEKVVVEPVEEEVQEVVVQPKIHKKRIACIGGMICLLVMGTLLYRYIAARGLLDLPIYYVNQDKVMVLHENTGTAKSYSDFDDSDAFRRWATMSGEVDMGAKVTMNGKYCLYPDNMTGTEETVEYDLMIRKVGENKGKLLAEEVFCYEEVSENLLTVYSRNTQGYAMILYDLEKESSVEIGTRNGQVIQFAVNPEKGMMVWVEANYDDNFSLYCQKLDQTEEVVCLAQDLSTYRGFVCSEDLSYLYCASNTDVFKIENFGTPESIGTNMSFVAGLNVGNHGEIYVVKNRTNEIDPFDFIEMDVELDSQMEKRILNEEFYYPTGDLYYYSPEEGMSFVTERFSEEQYYMYDTYEESPVFVYDRDDMDWEEKMPVSSITSANNFIDWMSNKCYGNSTQDVVYNGHVIVENVYVTSIKFDSDMHCVYYTEVKPGDTQSVMINPTELKKIDLQSDQPIVSDVDTNAGAVLGFRNGLPYYVKESSSYGNSYTYHVSYAGEIILKDMVFGSVYFAEKDDLFWAIRGYDDVQGTGILVTQTMDGGEKEIIENVSSYAVLDDQRMLIITKDKFQDEKMYVYRDGKLQLVDQGRFKILSQMGKYWSSEQIFNNHMR